MNWAIFSLLSWLFLGLETGFRSALQVGSLAVVPSFVLILVVYVSLWARTTTALAAAMILGCFLDLLNLQATSTGESVVILGPWALGSALASYTVLNFRAMVFRRNPLTMAFLCTLGAAVAHVLVIALLTLRSKYDVVLIPSASADLWQRLGSALYTGMLGLIVGPALNFIGPWLGFKKQTSGGAGGFRYESARR